jgi:RNA polymerase sigma factor (sigma-70 family)
MNEPDVQEIELTPDLIEYVRAIALTEAEKRCPKYVDYGDVLQEVMLHLISKPPKYDPSRGASVKTLLHTIIQRQVLKYVARQCRHAKQFTQVEERTQNPEELQDREGKLLDPQSGTAAARSRMISLQDAEEADEATSNGAPIERRASELTATGWTMDDALEFIDDEASRELCRVFMECDGNRTETARRLGVSEGTIRYRLSMLEPRLIAAGFNPRSTPD